MKIVLIGYRCTGKTSVGKKLAAKLSLPFYDTDAFIEAVAGQTIKEMVESRGWEFFRDKEKECLQKVAMMRDCVISTGGGAVMDELNAAVIKEDSVVIWLAADTDTIVKRFSLDTATAGQRPPLREADVRQETEALLNERTPVYRRLADIVIDTAALGVDEAVDEICRFIDGNNDKC